MKLFLFLISLYPEFNLKLFSSYDLNHKDYYVLFQPDLIIKERIKALRVYFNGGYYYLKQKQSHDDKLKLYQFYLKFYRSGFEIKTGKLVFIPGFLGTFNIFFNGLDLSTVSSTYEGKSGILLRYNRLIYPAVFIFEEDTFKYFRGILQVKKDFGKFTGGLYLHKKENTGLGFFAGYFSNYTFKLSLLKEGSNVKLNTLLRKRIKDIIFEYNLYYSKKGEIFPFFGTNLYSKYLFSIDVQFPEKIFNIPFIMFIYDYSNKVPLLLLDYKCVFSNKLTFEIGSIPYLKSDRVYFSVYGGVKFRSVL